MEPSVLDTSPCLFQRKFSFDELADPLKKIAIPQHGPQNKLPNYTIIDTKYQNGLRKQIIATAKLTHLRSNQRYIAIFATTSCKSTLDNVPYFGIDGLSMILCLWHPPPPLIKVASNTRPCSKLGGITLNGREKGGQYYTSQTCDQERFEARKVSFSWSVSTFLQLVVASYPLLICTADPRPLPVSMCRYTSRRSG